MTGAAPRAAAHVLLILVGLGLFVYPLTFGATPTITCRGVEMGPGDSCSKAGDAGVQTFEQRLRTARQARPVLVGTGVLVVAFGTVLLVADRRRRRSGAEHSGVQQQA